MLLCIKCDKIIAKKFVICVYAKQLKSKIKNKK